MSSNTPDGAVKAVDVDAVEAVKPADTPAAPEAPAATTTPADPAPVATAAAESETKATPEVETTKPEPEPEATKPAEDNSKAEPNTEPKAEANLVSNSAAIPTDNVKLISFFESLFDVAKEADHEEMWGIMLQPDITHVPTKIVLQKFLNANDQDLEAAKKQLVAALKWRKKMQPKYLVDQVFDEGKFGGLGYVTEYPGEAGVKEVVSWNIYGAVKDFKGTFGDIEEFIRWRTALMELSIQRLGLKDATTSLPIDYNSLKNPWPPSEDPYKITQVHDYLSVSFLRMDPSVRAASKEIISQFATAYPELLKEKFFVNVPVIMGWVFGVIKMFVSKETVKKFHPLSYGNTLASEMSPEVGKHLPEKYGGQGKDLEETGLVVKTVKKED